jgi:hypothetical protein
MDAASQYCIMEGNMNNHICVTSLADDRARSLKSTKFPLVHRIRNHYFSLYASLSRNKLHLMHTETLAQVEK